MSSKYNKIINYVTIIFIALAMLSFLGIYAKNNLVNKKEAYTITYTDNGEIRKIIEVEAGTYSLNRIDKEGYVFNGWILNNEKVNEINVNNDIVLESDYIENDEEVYTVKYIDGEKEIEYFVQIGNNIILPAVSIHQNEIFEGWYNEDNKKVTNDYIPCSNEIITAVWKNKKEEIILNKESIYLNVGQSDYIDVISPLDEVSFESDDINISSVDNGVVTAKNVGENNVIIKTKDGREKSVHVFVSSNVINISNIEFNIDDALNVGDIKDIDVIINPIDATNKELVYKSSNPKIIKIVDGKMYALKSGASTISVKTQNKIKIKKEIIVNNPIKSINIIPSVLTLDVGKTKKLKIEIFPIDATDKSLTFKSSNNKVASVDKDGNITALSPGNSIISVTSNNKITSTINVTVNKVYASINFLSTQGNYYKSSKKSWKSIVKSTTSPDLYKNYSGNQSIVIKTYDETKNKDLIVLIDTGNKNTTLCSQIIDNIKTMSNKKKSEQAVIDYLIITHWHLDHVGCLNYIQKNAKVNNIVYKKTRFVKNNYSAESKNMRELASKNGTKVYEMVSRLSNAITVSDNLTLYLFNKEDVFANQIKCDYSSNEKMNNIQVHKYSKENDYKYIKDSEGYYYYFVNTDNLKYPISTKNISETSSPIRKTKKLVEGKYYFTEYSGSKCNENANSLVILADFHKDNNHKYAYLPSDLDNNGYPLFGIKKDGNYIYGTGTTAQYKKVNNEFVMENGFFVYDELNSVKVDREYQVAKQVVKFIGEKNLKNIIIYQQSHHGYNNSKETLELLKFIGPDKRNKTLYAVATYKTSQKNTVNFLQTQSYDLLSTNSKIKIKNLGKKGDNETRILNGFEMDFYYTKTNGKLITSYRTLEGKSYNFVYNK